MSPRRGARRGFAAFCTGATLAQRPGAPNVPWTEGSAEMLAAAAGAWMLIALDKPTWRLFGSAA